MGDFIRFCMTPHRYYHIQHGGVRNEPAADDALVEAGLVSAVFEPMPPHAAVALQQAEREVLVEQPPASIGLHAEARARRLG